MVGGRPAAPVNPDGSPPPARFSAKARSYAFLCYGQPCGLKSAPDQNKRDCRYYHTDTSLEINIGAKNDYDGRSNAR